MSSTVWRTARRTKRTIARGALRHRCDDDKNFQPERSLFQGFRVFKRSLSLSRSIVKPSMESHACMRAPSPCHSFASLNETIEAKSKWARNRDSTMILTRTVGHCRRSRADQEHRESLTPILVLIRHGGCGAKTRARHGRYFLQRGKAAPSLPRAWESLARFA